MTPIFKSPSVARITNFSARFIAKSNNRLRWVTVLPLKSVDASIQQMHEAKQNGAVGIFFSGIIGSLTLNNPHFMPIYAEAEKLGLPICVHTGQSSRHLLDFFDLELNGTFATSHVPPHRRLPRFGRQRDP